MCPHTQAAPDSAHTLYITYVINIPLSSIHQTIIYISTKIIFLTQAWTYIHLHTEKKGGLDQPSRSDTHWQIAHKRWSQMMRRAGIRMTHSHYALSFPWRRPEQHGQNVGKIALQFQALQGCLGVCEVQLIIIVLETAHIQTPDSTFPIQLQMPQFMYSQ